MTKGKLYLIPTTLGDNNPWEVLPAQVGQVVAALQHFVVEQEKTARRFIRSVHAEVVQADLVLFPLNKHTDAADIPAMLQPCLEGKSVGLMSEAGCPGVADPGAVVVALAHQKGIRVVPLVGPSSILLALMASGLNGQSFAFHGYLPIDKSDKKQALKQFEKISQQMGQTQLFIETPYRNNKMLDDLLAFLAPQTRLCIAADITLATEFIQTHTVAQWKSRKPDLHNRPCLFLFLA